MCLLITFLSKGFGSSQFHYHVGDASNTVSIIKTDTDSVFGGFTKALWNTTGYVGDYNTFLFSLRRNGTQTNLKFPNGAVDRSTSYSLNVGNYGPSFGYRDLTISSYSNKFATSTSNLCNSFACPEGISHI